MGSNFTEKDFLELVYIIKLREALIYAYNEYYTPKNRVKKFHYSDFVRLESLINETLQSDGYMTEDQYKRYGNTIDVETLRRLFRPKFTVTKRKIPSLDKLCIFLGYDDWSDFRIEYVDKEDPGKIENFFKEFITTIAHERLTILKKTMNIEHEDVLIEMDRYHSKSQLHDRMLKTIALVYNHREYFDVDMISAENICSEVDYDIIENVAVVYTVEHWEIIPNKKIYPEKKIQDIEPQPYLYVFLHYNNSWKIIAMDYDPFTEVYDFIYRIHNPSE